MENYVQRGDVFVTRLSGSIRYVGVAAAAKVPPPTPLQYPDRLFCIRLVSGVNNQFFSHCFQYPSLRRVLEAAAKSSAGHQRISISDLHSLRFPLPPIMEQERIVAEMDRRNSVIDAAALGVSSNFIRADRLRQSILKRAFEGKLVSQDPNDEPASVLLERIRGGRAAKNHSKGDPQSKVKRKRTAVAVGK